LVVFVVFFFFFFFLVFFFFFFLLFFIFFFDIVFVLWSLCYVKFLLYVVLLGGTRSGELFGGFVWCVVGRWGSLFIGIKGCDGGGA